MPLALGAEAHLLNAGVMVDATGTNRWELHADERAALLTRHPRNALKRQIVPLVDREADRFPGCRFHFSRRWLWFTVLLKLAPYTE